MSLLGGGVIDNIGRGVGGQLGGLLGSKTGSSSVGGQLFGNRSDAGILGTGQYRGKPINIDEQPFKDRNLSMQRQRELNAQMGQAINRGAPTMSRDQRQFRHQQQDLADMLYGQSLGEGPSLAQNQ